jgi:hypothetical protein
LWEEVEGANGAGAAANADYWKLESQTGDIVKKGITPADNNDDGIPDEVRRADHLHIQDNP